MDYSIQDCEKALLHVSENTDGYVTIQDYKEKSREKDPSFNTFRNHLGGWSEGKEKIGIDLETDAHKQITIEDEYSDSDCLDAIELAVNRCDGYLGANDYRKLKKSEQPSVATIANKIGSWTKAKQELELDHLDNRGSQSPGNAKSINESYFDELDEESAYWLGFIYADGHIVESSSDGRPRFSLQISEKDKDHLLLLKSHLSSDHKIGENSGTVGLATTNESFCESLLQHGLRGDKTFSDTLPTLPDELFYHWLRGLFDGDGYERYSSGSPNVEIVGSEGRMKRILEKLPCGGTYRFRGGSGRITFYGDNARKLRELMYPSGSDTEPKLDRKYPSEWKTTQ